MASRPALAPPEWPARAVALDAERMLPQLARALRVGAEGARARPEATLVKETAGRRCVIRYRLGAALAVGKLYRDPERGARAYERVRALRRALVASAASGIPEPLAWLPELGLLLQEWRGPDDLRAGLASGAAARGAEVAAAWLGALHAAPPPPGLKRRTLDYELRRLASFAAAVAGRTEAGAGALREASEGLTAAAAAFPAYALATIHKDFYYAHVLWDGARVSIVDFDELSIGDPAFDVGHFVGHLERLADRLPAQERAAHDAAERFLGAYPAAREPAFAARIAFYRGYAALKLAATEAYRAEPDWKRSTEALVARAAGHARRLAREAR
jgi:aminoglycoside phosphotransferase (APT) family kinase protein